MHESKLGQLPSESAERDAIHVAIAPVMASHQLLPGQHVGINDEGKATGARPYVGIVDPFLIDAVSAGQRFYLILYPGSITSLRHEWTHPAFGKSGTVAMDDRAKSEAWLRLYAEKMNCYLDKDEAFDSLIHGLQTGELFFNGSDFDPRESRDLQEHAERYLGREIDFSQFTFSCTC